MTRPPEIACQEGPDDEDDAAFRDLVADRDLLDGLLGAVGHEDRGAGSEAAVASLATASAAPAGIPAPRLLAVSGFRSTA